MAQNQPAPKFFVGQVVHWHYREDHEGYGRVQHIQHFESHWVYMLDEDDGTVFAEHHLRFLTPTEKGER